MELTYDLERKDMDFTHEVANLMYGQMLSRKGTGFLPNLVIWTCLSLAMLSAFRGLNAEPVWQHSTLMVVGLCLALAAITYGITAWRQGRALRTAQLEMYAPYPIQQSVAIEETGVELEGPWGRTETPWGGVHSVREFPEYVAIILRPCLVCVVPNRAFESMAQREEMVSYLASRVRSNYAFKPIAE